MIIIYILSRDIHQSLSFIFFFFNDTATTEIYTLSLHDALPILSRPGRGPARHQRHARRTDPDPERARSEEHTSELQSRLHLVCRLLLEKKKKIININRVDVSNSLYHSNMIK